MKGRHIYYSLLFVFFLRTTLSENIILFGKKHNLKITLFFYLVSLDVDLKGQATAVLMIMTN